MSSSKPSPSSAAAGQSEHSDAAPVVGMQEMSPVISKISSLFDSLKKKVDADRCIFTMKKMEKNRQKLAEVTSRLHKLSIEKKIWENGVGDRTVDLLAKRQKDAIDLQNSIHTSHGDNDSTGSQDDGHSPSAILLGSSIAVKNAVRPIKLAEVKKLPPYTTWIFLDRNQRMTEDQSVVGRRRIYYDQNGGEALICSDSEEEIIEEDEEKKEFIDSEDYILRMTVTELGLSDSVLDILAKRMSRKPCELKARYEFLIKQENALGDLKEGGIDLNANALFDKDLDAALDSFDNLFCRRCLVFDCRLHGCSQDLIFPAEKQLSWNCTEEEIVPCGPHCYHLVQKSELNQVTMSASVSTKELGTTLMNGNRALVSVKNSSGPSLRSREKSLQSESTSSNARNVCESSESETRTIPALTATCQSASPRPSKFVDKSKIHQRNSKRIAEHVLVSLRKRQKKVTASDSDSRNLGPRDIITRSNSHKESEGATSSSQKTKTANVRRSRRREHPVPGVDKSVQSEASECPLKDIISARQNSLSNGTLKKEECVDENVCKQELNDLKCWKVIEKALFEKGMEMFGRNSCLIARNLMNGMKTCAEVFYAMNCSESKLSSQGGDGRNSLGEGCTKVDGNENLGAELRRRSRFLRRRGRVRRLKYSWKSAGYHSMRKRISEQKDLPCRQYNPCGCQAGCGKECPCLVNGTCCEKYCGCPKTCKNRFRGCHCAKSQCRSRQCPCFAAGRECDPDVCRNCWISCGDGTLGIPCQRGDNYECRNMKLLLKQQQRVLLGRSDVSGWGAFLKNSVAKHEYLGEYTGELISHREADKRGKIYDRENSSFLFNLNDQYVLDAYRKGDKLKFANHSPDPNCYAKVIMVAGDHRVGIFAKERICAGEELFYDYRYEPDRAPAWARKPEASGTKKEEIGPSSGRAKKLA